MKRIFYISVGFVLFGMILLIRLVHLQIFCYEDLVRKADSQEIYTVQISESVRGDILDRNDVSVTADHDTNALLVVPILIDHPESFVKKICEMSDFSEDKFFNKIVGTKENGETIRKQPFIAKSDLSEKEVELFKNTGESGIYIVSLKERYYRDLPAQHLVGALQKQNDVSFGISGLEYIYNEILSGGSDQKINFLINEKNHLLDPTLYYKEDEIKNSSGHLKLTLDLDIQRAAEAALGDLSGAVVVLDSKSADVLALVSSPTYDPYLVTELKSNDAFVNKALQAYPPASLFKIFIAAVGLEKGIVAKESAFYCDGCYKLSEESFVSCWNREGHGFLTLEDSLAFSCNPVYVNLALRVGKDRLKKSFSEWELDQDLLLGYPLNELSSLAISGTSPLSLANVGLGENGVFMTPLNVAKMINVVASGGYVISPRIVTESYDTDGKSVKKYISSAPKRVISKETTEILTDMMVKTFCLGTGENLNLDSFSLAGKTGTSETGNVWVGGFFPYYDPQYTVVVLVTGAKSGAADAGPVMKKICGYLGNYPESD